MHIFPDSIPRCSAGCFPLGWCFSCIPCRGANNRSRSPSPRVGRTDIDADRRVLRHVRDEAGTCCNTTDLRRTPPPTSPLNKAETCRGTTEASIAERSRTRVDREEGVQSKAGKSVRRSVSFAFAVYEASAAGDPPPPQDKKEQQQRPAVELREPSAHKGNEKSGAFHRSRVLAMDQGPAPFGSENRRRKAAQGVKVVRQFAAELDKISSL